MSPPRPLAGRAPSRGRWPAIGSAFPPCCSSSMVITVVLAILATGYVAMTWHVINVGAFYALIGQGLGCLTGWPPSFPPTARGLGIAVTTYGVLSRGLLSTASARATGADDPRIRFPRFRAETRDVQARHLGLRHA